MMTKLNRQLMVSCSLAGGLLLASAPAVLAADPPANNQANSANNQANPANNQANPANNQANPANNQANSANNQANSANNQANSANNQANSANNQANSANNQANPANNQANSANNQAKSANNQSNSASNEANAQGNPGNNNPGGGNPGQSNQAKANQAQAKARANENKGEPGAPKTDPPGNNGTIKVDMNGDTSTRNNEPQGGCQGVTIKFFNFDGREIISVAFSGQEPTPFAARAVPNVIADGNGDGSATFSFFDIVPSGTASAPNGGYHVRVEANGLNHPAGVKTKVFWLRCERTDTPPAGNQAAVAGTQVQNQAAATTATPNRLQVGGVLLERRAAAKVAGTQQARVASSAAAAGVNNAARARVLGTTVQRAALARTGLDVIQLATLGALTLLAGFAALRVSRRKSAPGSHFVA